MKTFTYQRQDGAEGKVQANTPEEAIRIAKDRAPASGVQEERSLPSLDETGKDKSDLPERDSPSRLVSFTRTVQRATALARQTRNKQALATTGAAYPEGILPNFGSILSNLNSAGDSFANDLIDELKTSREEDTNTYEMRTVGKQLIQFELGPSGEVLGQKVIATAPTDANEGEDFFTDDAVRDLKQGRLTAAAPEVQVAFTRTPKEFRDSWVRNNIGTDNSAVALPALLADLEDWERYTAQKKATDGIPTQLYPTPAQ